MARDGNGTFNRLYDWTTDRDNGVLILAEKMDAEMDGMATALTQSIARDGQTTASARIPFAAGISVPVGSVSAASVSFTSDPNTGIYSTGAEKVAITCNGAQVAEFTASGLAMPTGALTITSTSASALVVGRQGATDPVLKVVASTASVETGISVTGAAAAAGVGIAAISSGTNEALRIDAKGSGVIRLGQVSTGAIQFSNSAVPTTTDGAALGTTALNWSDLFLASGGVINFDNGDVTITNTSNTLTFSCDALSSFTFRVLGDLDSSAVGNGSVILSGGLSVAKNISAVSSVITQNITGNASDCLQLVHPDEATGSPNANGNGFIRMRTAAASRFGIGAYDDGGGDNRIVLDSAATWEQAFSIAGVEAIRILAAGNIQFTDTSNWAANGSVATVMTSLGPAGSHTTIQEWLTVVNASGTTRWIPAY